VDYPNFRMIDEIANIDLPTKAICCTVHTPCADEAPFAAHFPGMPILPGVLQVEIVAQAAGLLCFSLSNFQKMYILAGVDKARFKHSIAPQEILKVDVSCNKQIGSIIECSGSLSVDGRVIAKISLKMGETSFPDNSTRKSFRNYFFLTCNSWEILD